MIVCTVIFFFDNCGRHGASPLCKSYIVSVLLQWKKRIASPSTILVGRTVPIHEPVLVLMHSILVEAGELGADP